MRPLYDDGASAAQEATRDYVLTLDAPPGRRRCSRSSAARSRPTGGSPSRRSRSSDRICPPAGSSAAGRPALRCPAAISRSTASRRWSPRLLRSLPFLGARAWRGGWCAPMARAPVRSCRCAAAMADLGRDIRRDADRARGRLPDATRNGLGAPTTSSGGARKLGLRLSPRTRPRRSTLIMTRSRRHGSAQGGVNGASRDEPDARNVSKHVGGADPHRRRLAARSRAAASTCCSARRSPARPR